MYQSNHTLNIFCATLRYWFQEKVRQHVNNAVALFGLDPRMIANFDHVWMKLYSDPGDQLWKDPRQAGQQKVAQNMLTHSTLQCVRSLCIFL